MFKLLKTTVREWQQDSAPRLAAALAYYTTFSLAPLLILIIAIAGLIGGRQAAQNQTMAQVQDLLGVQGRQFVQGMIESASQPSTGLAATAIGAITLLLGALGVFGELQNSLNTIWDVKPKPAQSFWDGIKRFILGRLLSFTMVLGIGFLLLASLVISAVLSALGQYISSAWPLADLWLQLINFFISFAVITLLFAMIFKFLPEAHIAWKDVWLGAAVTSALFTLGKFLIGLYLGRSSVGSTFGAAGSLAILLIWIYYSAQILFFGAEFTQVYANLYGSKIVPDADMMKITEQERAEKGMPRRETLERVKR
ncbi:MAG TPA: YihY/virulence factor BrkB family protein [Anaerolineales bacterium]|nr:YihY/virulence factor BrkB family protein [Anaerolineales bacterium]HLO28233.1 YihY/virulence factor BrkB family protein [Anaerolineales bacterium]